MDQRITVVTLGVADLARARRFYLDGLGFRASPSGNDHITFVDAGGIVLALFGRDALADDANLGARRRAGDWDGVTLAQNVDSRDQVDRALADAVAAGATLLKPAQEVFWGGYSGYFADPDGHVWEVAHNPFWPLDERGRVVLP
jgi:catechol 2,3-dioxygenase-like lactoylglutathione lyase family enzyme